MKHGRNLLKRVYKWGHRRVDLWYYALTEGKRVRPLKDIHAGQRCFIIGNGPSLKMHDLSKLIHEKKFATNMFFRHPDWEKIHLDYFCVSDPIHWQFEGGFPQFWKEAFRKLPYCSFFFETACLPVYRQTKELQDRRVYFLNLDFDRRVFEGDFSIDVARCTSWGTTVTIDFCLPLAYYFGFKEVFLIGCDCDYRIDQAPDFSQAFFYDKNLENRQVPEHDWKWVTGERIKLMMASYSVVKKVFEADGRKIYNAGYGGKLEVFERVEYDDLF